MTLALDRVAFAAREGEVHAILGENGAGKSTLVHVVAGFLRPDAGTAALDGKPIPFGSPAAARRAGIELVHQHFTLVPALTVAENLELARMGTLRGRIGGEWATAAMRVAERLGWPMNLGERVASLGVGARQRIEIVKALAAEPRVLILDEPTATLAPDEVGELLRVLRVLSASGIAVVFIAHKLPEVLAVADRATVLRAGRVVGERTIAETSAAELAAMMIGRTVESGEAAETYPNGEISLEVGEFAPIGAPPVSFRVRRGEIYGIGGVDGNGQLALAEALAGVRAANGWVRLGGIEREPRDIRVGYVPEDRQHDGFAAEMTIEENLMISSDGFFVRRAQARERAKRAIAEFDVRPPDPSRLVGALSGGNAQKVVLARALMDDPELVVASNPTRGLDVGATETVHRRLREVARRGVPVVLFSSDLDELFSLAGTTAFLSRGRLREGRDPALMSR